QRNLGRDETVGFKQAHEIGTEKNRKRGIRRRSRLSASHRVVEQRKVAEERAGAELDSLPVDGLALRPDQNAAVDDDIDGLALVALVEDDLVFQELALVQQAVDDLQFARRQIDEQRQSAQPLRAWRTVLSPKQAKHH